MLRGFLDNLTSSGYVEGWAYDASAPLKALDITVVTDDGEAVASGLAHHYREDLAAAGCGTGWCAYRLRLTREPESLIHGPLSLRGQRSGELIQRVEQPYVKQDSDAGISSVAQLLQLDPTIVMTLQQLSGCADVFNEYVRLRGVNAFVRAAYAYILGRPADPSGLGSYGDALRKHTLTPMQLVELLYDSDEFRSRPRLLGAPTTSAFPFRV